MMSKKMEIIINSAIKMANKLRHEYLTLEGTLYAMICDDDQVFQVIQACGADPIEIRTELEEFIQSSDRGLSILSQEQIEELSKKQFNDEDLRNLARKSGIRYQPEISMSLQRVIQRAAVHVQASNQQDICGINILVAMFDEKESFALYTLRKRGIERFTVLRCISHGEWESGTMEQEGKIEAEYSKAKTNPLEVFCTNLNKMAKNNQFDPLIGRSQEIERIVQILCRRQKNNPLLVGEPGVGKTALAEGLAKALVDKKVPQVLHQTVIFSLDMAGLVAGAKFRGEFEQRLKSVIKNLEQMTPKVQPILFIDEIHTVVGAGATTGSSMDASNLLRPTLAGGQIRIMGSTTHQEYRKFVEKDGAFERRFQKIDIDEPNQEETYKILLGLKNRFEKHHSVKYSNKVLKAVVELSTQYINERKNPDKSIDVIDEAGAAVQLRSNSVKRNNITLKDIEATVAKFAKIPKISIVGNEKERLKNLANNLKRLIYGQNNAIELVTDAIIMSRSGLGNKNKPMANFLFAGPTGVGKTELARQLAIHLGIHLERFDMSEYGEKHSLSRLIGAPPGYVGHDEGGLLTDAVLKHPHCILLLDEIEKAHPEIYNILLQVMDYGKLTDSQGRTTDFCNAIIIITTNAGAQEADSGSIGLTMAKNSTHKQDSAIKSLFTPEFRNRLDSIIHFKSLNEQYVLQIVEKFLLQLEKDLERKDIALEVSLNAKKWLVAKGYNPKMGARELLRTVDKELKRPLSKEILFGTLSKGGKVLVNCKSDAEEKLSLKFQ